MESISIKGRLADVHTQTIYPVEITIRGERIHSIMPLVSDDARYPYIIPGFVDAHVHIESSMLVPAEFARLAVVHGTVATVSDPHEIANVCGVKGIDYMIDNGNSVPFKFNFGAPSCVPATSFETAGAVIDATAIDELMRRTDILYLSEMMNFPGVLNEDPEVMKKIASAHQHKKPVDGHAPGLTGAVAKKYIDAGISTDHECFTADEALSKLSYGMKILIREGSAAKNFEALIDLLQEHSDHMMFCSDDKHPDSLADGHINDLCARAVAKGIDVFKVLKAACVNPVRHYKLKVGLLTTDDFADLVLVEDLTSFKVIQTYINGKLVAENGRSMITTKKATTINQFEAKEISAAELAVKISAGDKQLPIIEALDGQLITNKLFYDFDLTNGTLNSNVKDDILKIVVFNRYKPAAPAISFIKNFGLRSGAIASSVAHDSHNIVAVGVDDNDIARAINLVIKEKGGISCVGNGKEEVLALPVAGLMSTEDGYVVAEKYSAIDKAAKDLGSTLSAPFMTLSFMALLVIPHLKLSDLGLFDGDEFKFL